MTEETATSGKAATVDRVINWELSVKHRAVARGCPQGSRGGAKGAQKQQHGTVL